MAPNQCGRHTSMIDSLNVLERYLLETDESYYFCFD
jgi:hypothetical protein